MSEKHLLLGGLGFVGINLAKVITGESMRPVIVARRSSLLKRRFLYEVLKRIGADFYVYSGQLEVEKLFALYEPEIVFYLAGRPGGSFKACYESHVGLLKRVIPVIVNRSVKLVYFSSIAVAADSFEEDNGAPFILEENTHLNGKDPKTFNTYHSVTKAMGERMTINSLKSNQWVILRPGLIYGEYAYHPEWKLIRALTRLRIAPFNRAPVIEARRVSKIAFRAFELNLAGRWVNAVEPEVDLKSVLERFYCKGKKCFFINIQRMLSLGKIFSKRSPLRLAWSILRHGRKYSSRYSDRLMQNSFK